MMLSSVLMSRGALPVVALAAALLGARVSAAQGRCTHECAAGELDAQGCCPEKRAAASLEAVPARALKAYDKTCLGGDAKACEQLAQIYWDGVAIPKNDLRALRAWQAGCAAGSGTSCARVAWFHENGHEIPKNPP